MFCSLSVNLVYELTLELGNHFSFFWLRGPTDNGLPDFFLCSGCSGLLVRLMFEINSSFSMSMLLYLYEIDDYRVFSAFHKFNFLYFPVDATLIGESYFEFPWWLYLNWNWVVFLFKMLFIFYLELSFCLCTSFLMHSKSCWLPLARGWCFSLSKLVSDSGAGVHICERLRNLLYLD